MNNYSGLIFSLVPCGREAAEVVAMQANWQNFGEEYLGVGCLSLDTRFLSNPTRFKRSITFGRDSNSCDILLPNHDLKLSRSHCAFLFTETGELMLEDLSISQTVTLCWTDKTGRYRDKHSLQGSPLRRRIIPMSSPKSPGGIIISLREGLEFRLAWRFNTASKGEVIKVRKSLAAIVTDKIRRGIYTPLDLEPSITDLQLSWEPTSKYTPIVRKESDRRPLRQTHVYYKLGEGGYGTVSRAVDLATGKACAIKTCNKPAKGESWKRDFKSEVEHLARLKHPHIIRLEHHQGWSPGRPVEIFMPLCRGHLERLLEPVDTRHDCYEEPTAPNPPWLHDLIRQILSAVAYLQKKGIVHRDIKPDNILYDGDPEKRVNFLLSDFGLSMSQKRADKHDPGGTVGYMPPETSQEGRCHINCDIYSFSIVLLEVLGLFCPDEGSGDFNWREKLRRFGAKNHKDYHDERPLDSWASEEALRGHCRVRSLLEVCILPKALRRMLAWNPDDRPSASEARRELCQFYPRRA